MVSPSANSKSLSIGNYTISTTIGQGTFGKVYLGVHSPTGEKVAVKVLEKEKITEKDDIERVAREISILKVLRHPYIVQLYEIIETPKHLYLIMEYASGGELFEYIVSHQRVREIEACKFFQQLVAGVEHLAKLNIVHRDLKPENLLIDQNRGLKIADFGLSNTYKTGETLLTPCGSPCYAAPEMIKGEKYNGAATDIWSCGVVLFAMICGFLPFDDPNTSKLYEKIIKGEFVVPKFVSEPAKELIQGILNVDPEQRFALAQIKSHKWFLQINCETGNLRREKVCESVLRMVAGLGMDLEEVRKSVEKGKHNYQTAAYWLLVKRTERNGGAGMVKELAAKQVLFKKIEPVRKQKGSLEKKDKVGNKLTIARPSTSKSPVKLSNLSFSKPSTPCKSGRGSVSPSKPPKEPEVYSGPYNIECISFKSPVTISQSISSAISQLKLKSQTRNYKTTILDNSNLSIEILKFQSSSMYFLKFSNVYNNTNLVDQLLNLISL